MIKRVEDILDDACVILDDVESETLKNYIRFLEKDRQKLIQYKKAINKIKESIEFAYKESEYPGAIYDIENTINELDDLQDRIDKAIKLIEDDYFEDGSGRNIDEVLVILKGE